jgi:hypothetical protein
LYVKNEQERYYKIIFEYKNIYPDNPNNIAKIAICKGEPLIGQQMLQGFQIFNNKIKLTLLISTYLRMEQCTFVLYKNHLKNSLDDQNYVCLDKETALKEMFKISKNF